MSLCMIFIIVIFFVKTCSSNIVLCPSQQQIRDLNIAKRVEDIGFYAGFVGHLSNSYAFFSIIVIIRNWIDVGFLNFLGASYMLGRAFTSIPWGILADRIGRKPIIVATILFMLVDYL